MEKIFITDVVIEKVRHLENVHIPLSQDKLKHLIITGKNGSGKTSVLNAMAGFLNAVTTTSDPPKAEELLILYENSLKRAIKDNKSDKDIEEIANLVDLYRNRLANAKQGISIQTNCPLDRLHARFEKGEFIVAYYKAERVFEAEIPRHVEKVVLKDNYTIMDCPRQELVKYLLDLKMTQALALTGGKTQKADKIKKWFNNFEQLLQRIFEDQSLKMEFDEDTFTFSIRERGREAFDFNGLSSGYSAVLDIVADLIMRMEKRIVKDFYFDMPGIVLIDEIETHLHLGLQRRIMDLLTTIFPKIQFIVSTHSPFILNAVENSVIYDLENHVLAKDGLTEIPYEGIVESYFKADTMSELLKNKYERFKELVFKTNLTDDDFEEIARLEMFLDEVPDYLALGISTEYKRLKLDFESREDLSW